MVPSAQWVVQTLHFEKQLFMQRTGESMDWAEPDQNLDLFIDEVHVVLAATLAFESQ